MNIKSFSVSPDKIRKMISLILSFLLSWTLVAFFLSVMGRNILSESYIHKVVASSGYAKNLQAEILEEWESYGIPGGLPEHFFDDKLPMETLKADLTNYISSQYNATPSKLTDIETELYNSIVKYAQKKMQITDEVDKQLKYLAELCANEYQTAVCHAGFRLVLPVAKASIPKFTLLLRISLIASIFLAAFIFVLHRKIKNLLIYIYYVFFTDALILLLVPLFCLVRGIPKQLGIADASLYELVGRYIGNINLYMGIAAAVCLFVAIGALVAKRILKSPERSNKM